MSVTKMQLDDDSPLLKASFGYLAQNVREVRGKAAHPVIASAYVAAGFEIQDDVTAWCGAYQALLCQDVGLPLPPVNPLGGINWESWGSLVYHEKTGQGSIEDAQRGDLMTIYYAGKDTWKRHVCQFLGFDGKKVVVIGGNQSNAVTVDSYPIANVASVRRPVYPTRKDLRDAGSTEIAFIDKLDKTAIGATVLTAAGASAEQAQHTMATGVDPAVVAPAPTALPLDSLNQAAEGVTAGRVISEGLGAIWHVFAASPWLFVALVVIAGLVFTSRRWLKSRIARHMKGQPVSTQVPDVSAAMAAAG